MTAASPAPMAEARTTSWPRTTARCRVVGPPGGLRHGSGGHCGGRVREVIRRTGHLGSSGLGPRFARPRIAQPVRRPDHDRVSRNDRGSGDDRLVRCERRQVRRLREGAHDPGAHHVAWNGPDDTGQPVASGICSCRMGQPGHDASWCAAPWPAYRITSGPTPWTSPTLRIRRSPEDSRWGNRAPAPRHLRSA